ncbi:hypothetical protein E4U53_004951 [Claviceps sorghi]|nr:hypothetical protein E4U53_004951 [Claviceps sorghi]
MVSKFREYLNNSPRYEELREGLPYRPGTWIRGAAARRSQAMAFYLNTAEGEAFDDDMADEELDFEGLEAGDMIVDGLGQNHMQPGGAATGPSQASALPSAPQSIPVPPPAPDHGQHQPFASSRHAHPVLHHLQQLQPHQAAVMAPVAPLSFSSFMTNHPASGNPPLSAHGRDQASMATLSAQPRPSGASSSSATDVVNGASTATMHRQPQHDEEQ